MRVLRHLGTALAATCCSSSPPNGPPRPDLTVPTRRTRATGCRRPRATTSGSLSGHWTSRRLRRWPPHSSAAPTSTPNSRRSCPHAVPATRSRCWSTCGRCSTPGWRGRTGAAGYSTNGYWIGSRYPTTCSTSSSPGSTLPGASRRLLGAAAAIGTAFRPELLAGVCGTDVHEAVATVEEAVARGYSKSTTVATHSCTCGFARRCWPTWTRRRAGRRTSGSPR